MEAITQTKVDMQVHLGIYVSPDGDYTAYDRQRVAIEDVLKTYGTDHISGITGEFTREAQITNPQAYFLTHSW